MKSGIHSSDWSKLMKAIKEEIPKPYAALVIRILERFVTRYF